jgi:hypothetical protein
VGEYLRPGVKPNIHFVKEKDYVPEEKKPFVASGLEEAPEETPDTLSGILAAEEKDQDAVSMPDAAEGAESSKQMFE